MLCLLAPLFWFQESCHTAPFLRLLVPSNYKRTAICSSRRGLPVTAMMALACFCRTVLLLTYSESVKLSAAGAGVNAEVAGVG
jgi:hypothetical protein